LLLLFFLLVYKEKGEKGEKEEKKETRNGEFL